MNAELVTPLILLQVKGRSPDPSPPPAPNTNPRESGLAVTQRQDKCARSAPVQLGESRPAPREPDSPGPARLGFPERPMTLQNQGRGPGPGPAHRNPDPAASRRTNLSYSDRVRNMARTGGGSGGYAGFSRATRLRVAP